MDKKKAQDNLDLVSDVIWYLRGYVDLANKECVTPIFTQEHIDILVDARIALAENLRKEISKSVDD